MKTTFTVSLLTSLLCVGCASQTIAHSEPSLENVLALPIGSTKQAVLESLGSPDKVETTKDGATWTYTVRYKKWDVPRTVIQLDNDDRVVGEHINLIKQLGDQITLTQLKERLSGVNPTPTADNPKSHYIPSTTIYHDAAYGFSAEVKKENDGVAWFSRHKSSNDYKSVTTK